MQTPIDNQTKIPPQQWRYGLRSSAKTGCGWIAVYNALIALGESPLPETIISALERQLPLIHGNLGTSVLGPALLLKRWGYDVTVCSDISQFDSMCRRSEVSILFYYWRKNWKIGAHFVAVKAKGDGFYAYNTYTNSNGPDFYGDSLENHLRRNRNFGCVLTCVRKNSPSKKPTGHSTD